MAEQPSDVVSITPTEYNAGEIRTDFLAANIETDDAEFGVTVHRDGTLLALSSGTVTDEKPALSTYHSLTPEQARKIARGLNQAADEAEEAAENSEQPPSRTSLIQKLLG